MAIAFSSTFAFGQQFAKVSIVNLIAEPKKYHNKSVRVIGASQIAFEGSEVCLSKDDLLFQISSNCLYLKFDIKTDNLTSFNGKYVLIEGVFDAKDKGHGSLNSGTIKEVTRYYLWEDRD